MSDKGQRGTALVTGASSGIGAVYADRLAARGHDLILVARDAERLRQVADRIGARYDRRVRTVVADLADGAQLAEVEALLRTDAEITVLINNAGVGAMTPLLGSDIEHMAGMIAVNVTAVTRLTYAAVPGFVARGAGTLVNVASPVALAPELMNGVYGGTKAFVLGFSQSLRKELGGTGVHVQLVVPGVTDTGFWDATGTPVSNLPSEIVMSAEDMVDSALAGLDAGEFVTAPALPDATDWNAFEASRQALASKLSNVKPAARYALAGLAN